MNSKVLFFVAGMLMTPLTYVVMMAIYELREAHSRTAAEEEQTAYVARQMIARDQVAAAQARATELESSNVAMSSGGMAIVGPSTAMGGSMMDAAGMDAATMGSGASDSSMGGIGTGMGMGMGIGGPEMGGAGTRAPGMGLGGASGMASGLGSAGMSGMGMAGDAGMSGLGMPGGVSGVGGMPVGGDWPAILFTETGPALNPNAFQLTPEQLTKVNSILQASHERYVKEEALHASHIPIESGGPGTMIQPFPAELMIIENELWTQLDDLLPVELQQQMRDRLDLFEARLPGPNATSGSSSGMGDMEMGGMASGGMGMGTSDGAHGVRYGLPGLLGWPQSSLPVQVTIQRNGRWYDWSVTLDGDNRPRPRSRTPELPPTLTRFNVDPPVVETPPNEESPVESP